MSGEEVDWWPVLQIPELARRLDEADSPSEWNGALAGFVHVALHLLVAQHPNHDAQRDAIAGDLLRRIERGFVPASHRPKKMSRARLDAAICAGCRTQAEAVALLRRLSPQFPDDQGARARRRLPPHLTEGEARSRVRRAMQAGLKLDRAPPFGRKPPPKDR